MGRTKTILIELSHKKGIDLASSIITCLIKRDKACLPATFFVDGIYQALFLSNKVGVVRVNRLRFLTWL